MFPRSLKNFDYFQSLSLATPNLRYQSEMKQSGMQRGISTEIFILRSFFFIKKNQKIQVSPRREGSNSPFGGYFKKLINLSLDSSQFVLKWKDLEKTEIAKVGFFVPVYW